MRRLLSTYSDAHGRSSGTAHALAGALVLLLAGCDPVDPGRAPRGPDFVALDGAYRAQFEGAIDEGGPFDGPASYGMLIYFEERRSPEHPWAGELGIKDYRDADGWGSLVGYSYANCCSGGHFFVRPLTSGTRSVPENGRSEVVLEGAFQGRHDFPSADFRFEGVQTLADSSITGTLWMDQSWSTGMNGIGTVEITLRPAPQYDP